MTSEVPLSIVLPVHNCQAYLEVALNSTLPLLEQGAELLIVDDGSTDLTPQLAMAFANQRHSVRVLRQTRSGPSAARLHGLRVARGSHVTFLDADDALGSRAILDALRVAQLTGCSVVKTRISEHSDLNHPLPSDPQRDPPTGCPTHSIESTRGWLLQEWGGFVGCVYDLSLARAIHTHLEGIHFGEDLVFTYALAISEPLYASVSAVGYYYRVGQANQSTAPESARRLSIVDAFSACEALAIRQPLADRALLWVLIQRYRWSRARNVSPSVRTEYRHKIRVYARKLRIRLRLGRIDVAREIAHAVRIQGRI
jgi:glycosyltransferase involved in cell wall biosynthesis